MHTLRFDSTTRGCRPFPFLVLLLAMIGVFVAAPARAQHGLPTDRFTVNLGGVGAEIDSQLRFDSSLGDGTSVDVEDDLGLDSNKAAVQAEAIWWLTKKQRVSVAYVDISRESSKQLAPREIQIGDKIFQANTEIASYVDTRYLAFRYGYAFVKNDRWELGGFLGLDAVRFRAGIDTSTNERDLLDRDRNDGEFLAPVPEFGGFFAMHFGQFILSAQANYFKATIKDITASNSDVRAGLTWRPWDHVGIGGGLLFDRLTADADKRLFDGHVSDDFVGPEFYLQFGW